MQSLQKLSASLGRVSGRPTSPVNATAIRSLRLTPGRSSVRPAASGSTDAVNSPRKSPRISLLKTLLTANHSNLKWTPDRKSVSPGNTSFPVILLTPPPQQKQQQQVNQSPFSDDDARSSEKEKADAILSSINRRHLPPNASFQRAHVPTHRFNRSVVDSNYRHEPTIDNEKDQKHFESPVPRFNRSFIDSNHVHAKCIQTEKDVRDDVTETNSHVPPFNRANTIDSGDHQPQLAPSTETESCVASSASRMSPVALTLPSDVRSTPGERRLKKVAAPFPKTESPAASAPSHFPCGEARVAPVRLRRRLFVTSLKYASPQLHVRAGESSEPCISPPADGDEARSPPSWNKSPVFAHSAWLPCTPGAKTVALLDTPVRDRILVAGLDALSDKPRVLGRGGFGVVVHGVYRGQQVALKIVSRPTRRQHLVEASLRGERNALSLRHPHIVRTLFVSRPTTLASDERFAVVIMEMAGQGHLANLLDNVGQKIDAPRRLRFAQQVALAVQWCHSARIVHLDVKPSNVIVNEQDHCKLADFGCSLKLNEVQRGRRVCDLVGGTVAYRAPELFGQNAPTTKADVYSLGITLWQLLARQSPYLGMDPHTIVYKVGAGNMRPSNKSCETGSAYVKLYEELWTANVTERPTVDYAVQKIDAMIAGS